MAKLPPLNKTFTSDDLGSIRHAIDDMGQDAYEVVSVTEIDDAYRREHRGRKLYLATFRLNLEYYYHLQQTKLLDDERIDYVPRDMLSPNPFRKDHKDYV